MGKHKGRLDPDEVKRAIAAERAAAAPAEPFHSPFLAARARLDQLVPTPRPRAGKASLAERLDERTRQRPPAPTDFAVLRAQRKAERTSLAEAVKPIVRRRRLADGERAAGSDVGGDSDDKSGGRDRR